MNFKLSNALIWMAVFSLLVLTAVGITYRSTSSLVEKTIYDHLHVLTVETAKTIESWLNQQMKILGATADSLDYGQIGQNSETLGPLRMAMKAGHFSDVYIGLPTGEIIDGADWVPPETYDTRIRPWYLRAVEAGQMAVTKPYVDLVTMELVIALVTPLTQEGNFIGVLSADTVLDTLVENIVNVKVGETGYAFIVEKNGMILVHPDQAYVMKSKLQQIEPNLEWGAQAMEGNLRGTIAFKDHALREDHLLSFQKVPKTDWYLCMIVPRDEAYALTQKATVLSAVEFVLLVLGGLSLITLIGVGGSGLVLFVFSRRFSTTVQKQRDEITGINEDLKWNIDKRMEVEAYYQTLFNVANDAIMLCKVLDLIECNERVTEMFGGTKVEILGRCVEELFPACQPDGTASAINFQKIMDRSQTGDEQFFVWTFKRLDGTEFPTEVGLKAFSFHGEELTLFSIRDISKRVNAEEQLQQAQKMAAMGEMLGIVAHQWRQPLNTLSTYIASIQSAYLNDLISKNFIEKLITGADSQIQFMSKTIDDFRNFFKPSKQKRPFDFLSAVHSAVALMGPHLGQNEITCSVNQKIGQQKLIVDGHQSEFIHVLVNIINNAMESINERTPAEQGGKRELIIDVGESLRFIDVSVADSGGGIPEHLLSNIFDPYFTTKGGSAGTGLGLYMAKIIVEKEMNGKIWAENNIGGAKFTIRLPYSQKVDE